MKRKDIPVITSESKRHKKHLEKTGSSGLKKIIHLIPNFQSRGQPEKCIIMTTSLCFCCTRESAGNSLVLVLYRQPINANFSLAISYHESGIAVIFRHGNRRINVMWTHMDVIGVVKHQGSPVAIARKTVDNRQNFRLPRLFYHMISEYVSSTEMLKEQIMGYRKRTEEILAQFCPSLPYEVFSLIWGFGISDSFLSAQVFCDFLQLYHELMQDRCKNWLRILSIALYSFTQHPHTRYLLEKLNLSKFTSASQLLENIAQQIPRK
jgi:hypothetical protein